MDPVTALGAAAAAFQFAGIAGKALLTAYELYSTLRDVPESIRKQTEQLETLNATATTIKNSPALGVDPMTASILQRCTSNAEELLSLLEKLKWSEKNNVAQKAWRSVVGISQEKDMTRILEGLEREKSTLMLQIETVNSGILQHIEAETSHIQAIRDGVDQLQVAVTATADPEAVFMQSLFITDPRDDRATLIAAKGERTEGTCTWVLESEGFKAWQLADSSGLWITGGPGKGKTMISIYLTQFLEDSAAGSIIIYFFCDNRDDRRNSASVVLRA